MGPREKLEILKRIRDNDGLCSSIRCSDCPLKSYNCLLDRIVLIDSVIAKLEEGLSMDTLEAPKTVEVQKSGVKYDREKPDMTLLLIPAMLEIGEVFTFGKKKYAAYNYRGLKADRLIAAAVRHLVAHNSGIKLDEETGKRHLAHAACSLIMALQTSIENHDGVKFSDSDLK